MTGKTRRIAALARGGATILVLTIGAALAQAQGLDDVHEFHIEAQPLDAALIEFSEQADLQLMVQTELVTGRQSAGVSGALTASDALLALLNETDLAFQAVGEDTVAVSQADAGGDSDSGNRPVAGATPIVMAQNRTRMQPSRARQPTRTDSDKEEKKRPLEEIIVTGTNIRGVNPDSSPIQVIDSAALERSGVATVSEYLESLPQNFALNGEDGFNGTSGETASAINLRGLGANETLVLINGRRVASASSFDSFVDVSQIPVTAVERIEILLDGASAIYGSDAVAGVVNIILRDKLDGALFNSRVGSVTDGDLREVRLSASGEVSWNSGRLVSSYEYFDRSTLRSFERNFIESDDPFDLIPGEQRHSLSVAARQELSSNFLLSFDALASFEDSNPTAFFLGRLFENDVSRDLYWIGADISGDISGFAIDLSGSYSIRDERRVNERLEDGVQTRVFDFNTTTKVYTVDARVSRALLAMPGGKLFVGVGGGVRGQEVELQTLDEGGNELFFINPDRIVSHLFGEVVVPIFGEQNAMPLFRKLEFSGAVRYEHFSDFGRSINPKIGAVWAPFEGLTFRASYGTSFRAPELRSVNGLNNIGVFDPNIFTGGVPPFPELGDNVVLVVAGPNPDLGPQESESLAVGFEYAPKFLQGFSASINYFEIDYDNRVETPTSVFGTGIFSDPRARFLYTPNPDLQAVTQFIEGANIASSSVPSVDLSDPSTFGEINLLLDGRDQNLAKSAANGLDIRAAYDFDVFGGSAGVSFNSAYLFENGFAPAPSDPIVDNVDTFGQPVDLRFRLGFHFSKDGFEGSLFTNYVDSYLNDEDPEGPRNVDSWITVDASIAYNVNSKDELLNDLRIRLLALNLLDENPPVARSTAFSGISQNYDSANANPRGRFVALELSKRF